MCIRDRSRAAVCSSKSSTFGFWSEAMSSVTAWRCPPESRPTFEAVSYTHLPLIVAIIIGLAVGTLAGFISGFIVSHFTVPAFIITMEMMNIASGIAYAVSYTHLDVYKRQQPHNAKAWAWGDKRKMEWIPVSYTHLDVYKRQDFRCDSWRHH